ncbi:MULTISPECIES: DUF6124 family protein [unclassified Pseudomonas]|uniref:DUF6124 family protein n=1 Tax=unclassified Pseudomonas TaxID=196821 RepID=UPI00191432B8|nr:MULTISPECIES: DUF6124 family protein [unclassified Pseudomonas]MBK5550122.1 hypothetical protein [Pseudomonas sp. TH03]MEB0226816.1 DUF6124 family protein [Pseudomonas sp. 5S1]MEB0293884.1 DUF6124 family protein [Pseudomonas sp. 10S4]
MTKKLVPDPPITTHTSTENVLKDREAINRAIDLYLNPPAPYAEKPRRPSTMYMIAPDVDTESLLANACESLASASVLASDFANNLIGPQRHTALAIQQIIMQAELAVNRALDNVVPA